MAKRICSVSKAQFVSNAKGLSATVAGVPVAIPAKLFSTGSFGWYGNGKVPVQLADGTIVEAQLGLTLTVIGSKDASEE